MFKSVLDLVNGKKTYLVALATALFGLLGLFLGKFNLTEAVNYLLTAGTIVGFRSALNK